MELGGECDGQTVGSSGRDETSSSYDFAGFSIDSGITDALCSDGQGETADSPTTEQGISVERFFEECHDAGIDVFSESDFHKGAFIGSGATMEVYKASWKAKRQRVALKYFKAPLLSRHVEVRAQSDEHRRLLEASMLELRVLTAETIRWHDNVANLLGVSWHRSGNTINPILVMELAYEEHPTLSHFMTASRPAGDRMELVLDVLEGLSALHDMTIVHGDVKPENILIFESQSSAIGFSARLSDFGFCRPAADYKWGAGGTPYWNAPECLPGASSVLREESLKKGRDIFSFGLLTYYILTGNMPFDSTVAEATRLKLDDRVSGLISEKLQNASVPLADEVTALVGRMVSLQPPARPTIHEIRTVLKVFTKERVVTSPPQEREPSAISLVSSVLNARYNGRTHGVGDLGSGRTLDRALPRDLQNALYEMITGSADAGTKEEKSLAANRLGVFLLNGFGTLKNFQPAFEWFCKAANLGSIEGKKMVLRMERAAETLPTSVKADLTRDERASWMVDIIMAEARWASYQSRLAPEGLDIDATRERIRQALTSASPYTLRHGLVRDIEHNVVRILLLNTSLSPKAVETQKSVRAAAASVPIYAQAFRATLSNESDALSEVLSHHAIPASFLNRLVTVASDGVCNKVLSTLCVKYGADPDHVDRLSGRVWSPLEIAAMANNYSTVAALLQCGANAGHLISVATSLISKSDPGITSLVLGLCDRELAHQLLDGLSPLMNLPLYTRTKTPPDNTNPPALFEAVMSNSLLRLHQLLLWGANPNVCFQGWTAAHVAVRMLHPSALLFLLAFGADPNARSPRGGYATPLHTLSELRLRLGDDGGLEGVLADFLLRPYEPLPLQSGSGELLHRQALVVHILLQFGADPSLCCVDGFTALMTSVVSPSPDAKALTGVLLQSGISLGHLSSRRESVLHLCGAVNDAVHLTQFLFHGAKSVIDLRDGSGCTALFIACLQPESKDVVKILLENGANMLIRGTLNMSPLDIALLSGDPDTLEEIFEHVSTLPGDSIKELFSDTCGYGCTVFHHCLVIADVTASTENLQRLMALMPWEITESLLQLPDRNGYTPWQLAHAQENREACGFLSSPAGLNKPAYAPFVGLASTDLCTVEDISNNRQESLEAVEGDRNTTITSFESMAQNRNLEPVELSYQSELDDSIRSDGEESQETIWRMDTLGTVHERYGRLKKAQDVYYRGWKTSRRVSGHNSVVTQDLASKIVRVLHDRGAEGDLPDVEEWHASHGGDTLASGITYNSKWNNHENSIRPPLISGVRDTTVAGLPGLQVCSRHDCGKPPQIVCYGCKFVSYCSENCKVQDIVDPAVQHLSVCFPTEQIEMSQAIDIWTSDPRDPNTREIVQWGWNEVHKGTRRAIPPAPAAVRVATYMLTPRFFNKLVRFRIPPNSIVIFLNVDLYELRYEMASDSPWVKPHTVMSYTEMQAGVRPKHDMVQAATGGDVRGDEKLRIWVEINLDFDLECYFETS